MSFATCGVATIWRPPFTCWWNAPSGSIRWCGGSGHGWWSWIDLEDVLGAIEHLLHSSLEGPVNVVSPTPVRQRDFTRTLGHVLRRPAFLPLPTPAVKALFGEMGREVLLASQRVRPTRLEQDGFTYLHRHLEDALRTMLGHRPESH